MVHGRYITNVRSDLKAQKQRTWSSPVTHVACSSEVGAVGYPGGVSAPSSSSASCRRGWGCTASGPWSSSVWGLQEELLSGRGQLCVDRVSTRPSLPAPGSPRREVGRGTDLCWSGASLVLRG